MKAAQHVEALSSGLFGESLSLYNGSTEFVQVDIDIPGNNSLPVRLARRLKIEARAPQETVGGFADWEVEIPYIHAVVDQSVGWTVSGSNPNARCSSALPPRISTPYFRLDEVWHGTYMHIPGEGDRELLKNDQPKIPAVADGQQYPWITRDFYRIKCASSTVNGYPGESFIAISPNGLKYFFNYGSHVIASTLGKGTEYPSETVGRIHVYLRATRVEDRFGNYVNYSYSGNLLTAISSSDGRAISITSTGGKIAQATANGRSWAYSYRPQSTNLYEILNAVALPDGSAWNYDWVGMPQPAYDSYPTFEEERPDCPEIYGDGGSSTLTMRHPSGAFGEFVMQASRHRRDGVPGTCVVRGVGYQAWTILNYSDNYAMVSKKISGSGLSPIIWLYDYETGSANISQTMGDCLGCNTTKDIIVTNPDGSKAYHRFGVTYGVNEGRLLRSEVRDTLGNVKRVSEYIYISASNVPSMPFADAYGHSYMSISDPLASRIRPLISSVVSQDGISFSNVTNTFDVFAKPASVTKAGIAGASQTETTEYHNDLSYWVIGQVKKQTTTNASPNGQTTTASMVSSEVEYNAQALPWKTYKFGKLQQTLSYWPDGSLNTITDGRGLVTTLSDYSRGIPRLIGHSDGTTESASVDGNGWITAVTDEIGAKTCYGYDAMGRIASIVYPSETQLGVCDASRWSPKGASFQQVNAPEHGLPAGHWRQSLFEGNKHHHIYYDAMWRPVLEETYDNGNIAGTLSQVVKRYDTSGRPSFQSYPASNVGDFAAVTQGVRTFYDALDRVTRVEQDSEFGTPLATTTEYLPGLKTRVTNSRGFQTTTEYMAWDQPSYDLPILSQQPEGKTIQIARHPQFGWPLSLTQRNAANTLSQTRRYVYDGNAQMCKTIEPETGATVTGYDAAGNPAWSAAGLTGGDYANAFDCSYVAANGSGRVVNRTYDPRNRLSTLSFPDGRGNQIWTYANDGLPASITTYNGSGNTDPVVNAHTYNNRRLLTGETTSQSGWYAWSLGYGYDAIGNLSNQTYPTGLNIDYAPNALGQPTKAGTYATGAQYYPNGALKQFTYGNGIVHTMTQNARQLPSRVTSSGNVLDFGYDYDANGNPTTILDLVTGTPTAQHRWMSYDGLDRLTTSASAMYGGSDHTHRFGYDALDNITSWKHAGVKDYAEYVYDNATNRLTNIRNTAGATVVGLDYDPQGNLRNKNGQLYDFDYGNRLREVPGKESYRYDGLGRRVQTAKTDGSKTTLWQYSQAGQMLFSSDWEGANYANQKTHEHVYLAGSVVATIDHDWPSNAVIATKYQHTDALGSPVAATNPSGAVIERNDYEPYGAIIGKPTHSGIGYTGHVMDGATGLTYMQQRYYDQSIGRFLSVDPVTADAKLGANFNRYKYAANNPYRFIDPDGRQESNPDPGLVERVSDRVPFLKWLLSPSDTQVATKGDMIREQLVFENSQRHSAEDVVRYIAIALSAGTGAAGGARALVSAKAPATAISITPGATRASAMQIRVSMTASEARATLASNGFTWKGSERTPGAGSMTKDNMTINFSPTSNSTGLPSATVIVDGKRTAKLRFDKK